MTPAHASSLSPAVLGFTPDGSELPFDLHEFRVGCLIQASSGGGKSFLIRRLLEQTHGDVLQFFLDREGDGYTLREKYRYALIGGEGADAPAVTSKAAELAQTFLRASVSAIVNISDLSSVEEDERGRSIEQSQTRYVAAFLRGLLEAARADWKPLIVVIDEAHLFAPKEGSKPSSFRPVADFMSLGRKRGMRGILATQRIAKIHNDAIADATNKLIGLCSLSTDRERGADEIGMSRKESLVALGSDLKPGEFYAVGPAFHAKQVVKVKVGPVVTTHPEPGGIVPPVPPAPAEMRAILASLATVPAAPAPAVSSSASPSTSSARVVEKVVEKIVEVPVIAQADLARLEDAIATVGKLQAEEDRIRDRKAQAQQVIASELGNFAIELRRVKGSGGTYAGASGKAAHGGGAAKPAAATPATPKPAATPTTHASIDGLKSGAVEMLRVLVVLGKPLPRRVLGAIAGVSLTSGTVSDYVGQLVRHGFVVESDAGIEATAAGKARFPKPGVMPTGDELLARHVGGLKAGAIAMVNFIRAHGPKSRKELAAAAKVSATSGTVSDYVGKLKRCGLVEDEGGLVQLSSAWSFCRG